MKYLRLGIGTERVSPTTRRFMIDVGLESTKPANEKARNIIVASLFILALIWSLNAAADPITHPAVTVDVTEVLR